MQYVDIKGERSKGFKPSKHRMGQSRKRGRFIFAAAVVFTIGLFAVARSSFSLFSFFTPVSVFSQIINQERLKQTDGRTNILLLGVDRRSNSGYVSGVLTDTIMLISVDGKKKSAAIFSLPRDLWMETDDFKGKINSAYAYGGVSLTTKLVSRALGVPIHYFVLIDFASFEKAVDILGGIEITVDREFDDYRFPKLGFENAEPEELRYEYWHFDSGLQHMDGKKSLVFARSRHALGPEGSDFARMRRQQKVIGAVRDKVSSVSFLRNPGKIRELYDTFSRSVESDLGFSEVELLAVFGQDDKIAIRTYMIDGAYDNPQSLLYNPELELFGGQYVLLPKATDYSEIHYFVQKALFGASGSE